MKKILIGIDPGVKTGIGYINSEGKKKCFGTEIHRAMEWVKQKHEEYDKVWIRVEDARKRKWYGPNSQNKQQGAGSIKRDCKIWQDFLTDHEIPHEMVHPAKNATKLNASIFKRITGIESRTNEHGRDAFMLVHGLRMP